VDVDEVVLTGVQVCATAAITVLLPTRPSRLRPPPAPSVRTQRIFPARTASASHETLTSLSRPENPPSAATSAPLSMMVVDAPCWLETAIVPPPWALA